MPLLLLPLKEIGEHMHVWYDLFEPLKKYAFLICKKYAFFCFFEVRLCAILKLIILVCICKYKYLTQLCFPHCSCGSSVLSLRHSSSSDEKRVWL